jgi:F-type H+-transporting ATPase subunit epsilon
MAETFLLNLVTPEKSFFSGQVQELVAPGDQGEFGVLPGHAGMLAGLKAGRLIYRDDQGEISLLAGGGFAEVTGDRVTVLLDDAVLAEDLDTAALDAEIAQLEEGAPEPGEEGYEDSQKQLEWKRFCREQVK